MPSVNCGTSCGICSTCCSSQGPNNYKVPKAAGSLQGFCASVFECMSPVRPPPKVSAMLSFAGSLLKQTTNLVTRQLGWERPPHIERQAQMLRKLQGEPLRCAKKGMDTFNRLYEARKPPDRLERRDVTLFCKIVCVTSQPQSVLGRLLLLPRKLVQAADAAPKRVVGEGWVGVGGCKVAQLLLALAVYEKVVSSAAATEAAAAFYFSSIFLFPTLLLVDELAAGGDGVGEFAADMAVAAAAAAAAALQGVAVGAGLGQVGLQPKAGLWLGYEMLMWVGLGRWQQKRVEEQEVYDQVGKLEYVAFNTLRFNKYETCSAKDVSGSSKGEGGSGSSGAAARTGLGTGGVLSGGRAGLVETGRPTGREEGVGRRWASAVPAPPPSWWARVCRAWWEWWVGWHKWVWI